MKNIFKLMGVALLASSMLFVACKKDENTDEPNTPQEETIADGVSVTFNGGQAWANNAGSGVVYFNQSGVLMFNFQAEANNFPMFDMVTSKLTSGTETEQCQTTGQQQGSFAGGNMQYCEYYERTRLVDPDTNYYGDWWATEVTTDIRAIDLTNLTVTAKLSGTMFDAATAFVSSYGGVGFADAPRADFVVTVGKESIMDYAGK